MQVVLPGWVGGSRSLAVALSSVKDARSRYPLYPQRPPYVSWAESDEDVQYPLEVDYAYRQVEPGDLRQPPLPGIDRWQPLLPPIYPGLSLGEGGTPLLELPSMRSWAGLDELFVKDESRNPTWSHKDRLNLCTVSAAVAAGASGVAVSSSGNHGASAAAYAAAAGLKAIVLCDRSTSAAHQQMMLMYGAAVVAMPRNARWPLLDALTRDFGWYLLGNTAKTHTGHPFGPEGYKTVAYELYVQLGFRMPAAVAIPTSYAELLFGVWKGFWELRRLGLTHGMPVMISAEPSARAPHAAAFEASVPVASVVGSATVAHAIGAETSGYRGFKALSQSSGIACTVTDAEMIETQARLAASGMWAEVSSCAGLAALRALARNGRTFDGPVVAISTSTGLKGATSSTCDAPAILSARIADLSHALKDRYGIDLEP